LRSIVEKVMMDVMYEVPSNNNIIKVIITKECITENAEPTIVNKAGRATKKEA